MEFLSLFDQNLPRQVGVTELINVQGTQLVMGDIAELTRDVEAEFQDVEWKQRRQHLTDQGERKVDARTVRVWLIPRRSLRRFDRRRIGSMRVRARRSHALHFSRGAE